jgi:putative solute:sodium symporter small subunit
LKKGRESRPGIEEAAILHAGHVLLCAGRELPARVFFGGRLNMQVSENHRRYWQKNLNVTAILLAIWFVVTFVVSYFARDLNFNFFGWPFSFWVGAQGSLVVYCLIIWFYARYMNNLDIEHGVQETEE